MASPDHTDTTARIDVRCSFCGETTTVPIRVGAVMPFRDRDRGVRAWITGEGGIHQCPSERHKVERRIFLENHPEASRG